AAVLAVSDQALGEGGRVAQAVAGLDRRQADRPPGREGAVVAARAVAGDGSIADRGGELGCQGVGIAPADEARDGELLRDLPRMRLRAMRAVAELGEVG